MAKLTHPIKLLRSITSELRHALPEGTHVHQTQPMGYILSQYKKNAVTQEQHCKHQEEMTFMAETYLTYLSSQRAWYDVQQEFHAKGERTIAQTAKMVGFNLPHEPKVERRGAPKKE
eukprot:TRINITY_DN259_c0_g1_i1.p1 TRINITY_DN259_c0_g1~~TRINITY_DN259_c0_g1_i1.p1  ORF type:complete len:117 (-),score=34.72 TRINITY_DN259_c0_g1_i1:74-424(-)